MNNCSSLLKEVARWLKEGHEDAKTLVELPWEVEEVEKGVLKAVYPKFPVEILISCDDDIGVIRLQSSTDYFTISMENNERLKLYHKLLKLSMTPLVKFLLAGSDDTLIVAVDLSTKSLRKEEFNDALALLLATVNAVVQELGITQEYAQKMYIELLSLVLKHIKEGWGRGRLLEYLVKRAGLNREDAEKLLESIFGESSATESIYQ